jgi:hypothetical protein
MSDPGITTEGKTVTRTEAHRKVKTFNGPVAWVATCPYCKGCMVKLPKAERPTWGDRTKAVAKIADHILTTHTRREKDPDT